MGLLDDIENQLGGSQGGQQNLLAVISGLISNNGGLSGIINRFTQSGLEQHVQSWVGNGPNMAVTGDHIRQVFGSEQVQQVAQKLGLDHSQASSMIATVLPSLIDKLTPKGQVVSDAEANDGLSALLSKGLGSILGAEQRQA
jgi:uncharacterized protein YidB (DUF937 family)